MKTTVRSGSYAIASKRKQMGSSILIAILTLFLLFADAYSAKAQVPGCGATVPYELVDLTGNPDSMWISEPTVRQGQCCGVSNPIQCISYEVILDPNSAGIVMGTSDGALPPGSYFYQIGCGPQHFLDSVICLVGVGPHYITFCKPGGNTNVYTIQSIGRPTFPSEDSTRIGCFKKLTTYGLDTSTVTWNSIYPGASGAYNSYLSATSNTTTVFFTPGVGAPAYIDYQVCGQPMADECGYTLFTCDTVRMYVYPALNVTVSPNPAGFCASGSGVTLTATGTGGNGNFSFAWKDPLGVTVGTGTSILATQAGNYTVIINDDLSGPTCGGVNLTIPVTITPNPTVDAGADQSLCPVSPVVALNGSMTNSPAAVWTGGAGVFTPDAFTLTATYTPTAAEIALGSITLTLETQTAGACTDVSDDMTIFFGDTLSVAIPPQTLSCFGDSATLSASILAGNAPYTYSWSNGGSASSILVGAGLWCVTVTDALNCSDVECFNLIAPTVLAATATGTDATTPLGTDGTASVVASGGTAGYTYLWSTGGTTSTITGLPLGVYTVTVTDASGCQVVASAVVNDPRCAGFQATTVGGVVDCFDDETGYVFVNSVTGGSPPYIYRWLTSPVQLNDTAFGLGAGTYTVIVSDGIDCGHMVSAVITEPTQLTNAMSQTNNPIIGGSTGTATSNPAGATPGYTYAWSNGQTTQTATGLAAGMYYLTLTDSKGCMLVDSVSITEPPCNSLTVLINHANVSCNNGTDGNATAFVSGATPPVDYLWSTGAVTSSISALPAGSYAVTVTDSVNCQNFATRIITEPSPLSMALVSVNVRCYNGNDGSVDLSVAGGTPPYSFLWSNGSTSEDINLLLAGTYSVTVTDANGCKINGGTSISQPAALTLSAMITPVTCNGGSDGAVDIAVTGGQVNYSYLWSNASTSEDIAGLAAGGYVITVTDANNCLLTKVFSVLEPDTVEVDSVIVGCPPPGSSTAPVTVYVQGGAGAPYEVSFDNGLTFGASGVMTANLPVNASYQVIARDGNGCLSPAFPISILPSLVIDSVSYPVCYPVGTTNTSVTVYPNGGDGGLYYVSFDGGTTFGVAGDYTETLNLGSSYTVVIEDGRGCRSVDSLITLPLPLTASLDSLSTYACGFQVSCNGAADGFVNITSSGGSTPYSWVWSNGATTEDISGIVAGTYTVTITDAEACTYTRTFILAEPVLLSASGVAATYSCGYNVTCNGASDGAIDLTPAGGCAPYAYLWSNGATVEDPSGLAAGAYSVTVTDANGCTFSTGFTLAEPAALTASGVPATYNCGYNVSVAGGSDGSVDLTAAGGCAPYAYLWSNGSTVEDPSGLAAGTHSVTVTDANGCTFSTGFTLTEPAALNASGVAATFACGYNVTCNGASDGAIDLTATGGCAPYAYLWSNGATSEDPSGLAAGAYSVTVTDDNGNTFVTGFTLTEPVLLSASGVAATYSCGYNVTCNGATDGAIDLTPAGGCAPYAYLWSNGATVEDPSGLAAGAYSVTVTDANGCTFSTGFTLTEPVLLSASGVAATYSCGYNVTCNGASDGAIDLTPAGGCAPYAYLWSNGATVEDPAGLAAGTHSVTVTDANGCTFSTGFTLTEPVLLSASGVPATYNCGYNVSVAGGSDGSVALTPAGGCAPYAYLWSNGSAVEDPSGLAAGTHSVTVTDANGCTFSTGFTLTEPAALTASGVAATFACGYNVTCNGASDGAIDLTATGGCAPYAYLWSNGATVEDPAGLIAGAYSVTVTDDNGNTFVTGFTLTEPVLLSASGVAATYSCGYNVTCNGAVDGAIDLTPAGGCAPYAYLWSNGATVEDPSGLAAGAYSVTVTDANGCTFSTGFTLAEPVLLSASGVAATYSCGYNVTCNGASDGAIDLTPAGGCAPYAYLWSNGATVEDPSGLAAGAYSVTVTDANGCTFSTGFTLTEPAALTASGVAATYSCGYNVTCNGAVDGAIDLTPAGGCAPYAYLWSNGATVEDPSGLAAGAYSVTVTDANGCTFSTGFTLTEPAALTASGVPATYNCGYNVSVAGGSDGSVDLTPAGGCAPYAYLWSNGSTAEDPAGLVAGTHSVTVTDANGCTFSTGFTLIEPAALAASGVAATFACGYNVTCNGATDGAIDLTATGGCAPYAYLWSNGATVEDPSGLAAGAYSVTVTDDNGNTFVTGFTLAEPVLLSASGVAATYSCGYNVTCNGASDGAIDLTPAGGCAPYAYLWSNGATVEDPSGLAAGAYSMTVTDANGCTFSTGFTLTEPVLLSASGVPATYNCGYNVSVAGGSDGSVDLTPVGGCAPYAYLWSNGSTTEDPAGLAAGTHSVTVTDANGCTFSTGFTLTEPAALTVSGVAATFACGYNVTCNGATDGAIDLTATGGCAPYAYLWSNGSTSEDPSGLAAGAYSVTVTDDNGNTFVTGFTLTEPVLLSASGVAATYSCGYNVTCNGASDGAIDLTPAGGCGPYAYLWSNGATVEDPSGLAAGAYSVTVTDANGCTFSTGFTLTEPVLLSASGVPATYNCGYNVSVAGGSDGSVDLTPVGGCAPYAYLWSNGSTVEDPSGLAAGTHSVTVTDANGCTFSTGFTLTEPAALNASGVAATFACGYNVTCNGASDGAIDLTATGGCAPYAYLWSNGATVEDPSGLAAGAYSVTVTDDNGNTFVTGFTLTEPAAVSMLITPDTFAGGWNVRCPGSSDGNIDLAPAGGCAPFSYAWGGGQTTEDLANVGAGAYFVTITDANNCSLSDSIVLNEPPALTSSIAPLTYNGGWNISCNGLSNGFIDLTVSGGATAYAYAWSDGSTTEDLNLVPAAMYIVTITDQNGCTLQDSITLTEPQALTTNLVPSNYGGGWNISCNGANDGSIDLTVNGGTPGYFYLWSNGAFTEDVSGIGAGTYLVAITDNNGCITGDTISLSEPSPMNVQASISGVSCAGGATGAIDLTVSGATAPYTYLWSNGAVTEDVIAISAGNYQVTVTDLNGCTNITAYTVGEQSPVVITGTVTMVSCYGMNDGEIAIAVAGGIPPYTFFWSNGQTIQDVSSLAPGTYDVLVLDANSCQDTFAATIVEPAAIIALAGLDYATCSTTVTLSGNSPAVGQSGAWALMAGSGTIGNVNDSTTAISGLGVGPNILTWTLSAGNCADVDTVTITVNPPQECAPIVLEMPTAYSPNGDGANDYFVIHGIEYYPQNEVQVFNRWGNLVYSRSNYLNQWNGQNDNGGTLSDGTYFVILVVNNGETTLHGYVDLRR